MTKSCVSQTLICHIKLLLHELTVQRLGYIHYPLIFATKLSFFSLHVYALSDLDIRIVKMG